MREKAKKPRVLVHLSIALLGLLMLAVGISACGGSSATGADAGDSSVPGATSASTNVVGTEGATAPTGTPKSGGTIYYGHEKEPPCLIGGWIQEAYIDRQTSTRCVSEEAGARSSPGWRPAGRSPGSAHLDLHPQAGRQVHRRQPLDAQAVVDNF